MKVLVFGSGVVGTTTAYFLASRGYEVTVVERQAESALETSFANGGQLSYTHAEPWANPSVIGKIAKWMFKENAPLVFRFKLDPFMWEWGMRFLYNCLPSKTHFNAANILRLGLYSRMQINALKEKEGLEFDHLKKGILHLFMDNKSFERAQKVAECERNMGAEDKIMMLDACLDLEPSLQYTQRKLVGGIYHTLDESGDVRKFTQALAKVCAEKYNVKFLYNTRFDGFGKEGARIAYAKTSVGDMQADAYVMSLGSYSPRYLRPLGIYIPVYPMKGYSVTIPIEDPAGAPTVSLTDEAKKIVYSRLGDNLRAAGTAEIAGYDNEINEPRVDAILECAMHLFPKCGNPANAIKWCGLRPATPQGAPYLGRTKYENLYLNTGHGTLGWTLSCGSARVVADVIEGRETEIGLEGLSLAA